MKYQWDAEGRLQQRSDLRRALTESYLHDDLSRLKDITATGIGTSSVAYPEAYLRRNAYA